MIYACVWNTGGKLKKALLGKSWNFQLHKITLKLTLDSVHREKNVMPNTALEFHRTLHEGNISINILTKSEASDVDPITMVQDLLALCYQPS